MAQGTIPSEADDKRAREHYAAIVALLKEHGIERGVAAAIAPLLTLVEQLEERIATLEGRT